MAFPTVSMTASTRSGSRPPGSTAAVAPIASARARFDSFRLVANTVSPAATPSTIAAVATPPPAPCTRTDWPEVRPARVNSMR